MKIKKEYRHLQIIYENNIYIDYEKLNYMNFLYKKNNILSKNINESKSKSFFQKIKLILNKFIKKYFPV